MIKRRSVLDKVHSYDERHLKLAKPGTLEYDYLIDRMFFQDKADKRPWKERLEYSIIPAANWDKERHDKKVIFTDKL